MSLSTSISKFTESGTIMVDPDSEGAKYESGRLTLGMRSGPSQDMTNVLHELAHLVEIEDDRIGSNNWGLRIRRVEILGRLVIDPQTPQATQRECRVFGIQARMMEAVGIPYDMDEFVDLNKWLPDHYCSDEADQRAWITESYHNWNLERIRAEIARKEKLICVALRGGN